MLGECCFMKLWVTAFTRCHRLTSRKLNCISLSDSVTLILFMTSVTLYNYTKYQQVFSTWQAREWLDCTLAYLEGSSVHRWDVEWFNISMTSPWPFTARDWLVHRLITEKSCNCSVTFQLKVWPHCRGLAATTLVTRMTASGIQARCPGLRGAQQPGTTMSVRRLPARCYRWAPSASIVKCTMTCTSSRLGDRAFTAAGPRLWNSLPTHVRRLDLSLDTFRHKLKT